MLCNVHKFGSKEFNIAEEEKLESFVSGFCKFLSWFAEFWKIMIEMRMVGWKKFELSFVNEQ